MAFTLEQFSQEAHRILAADPGPEGRKKIGELVSQACTDPDFIAKNYPMTVPNGKFSMRIQNSVSAFSVMFTMARSRASRTITGRPGRFTARRLARRL